MSATVVIPTLNARELLAGALESLRGQTVAADVVVVDNASSDGTAELLADAVPGGPTSSATRQNLGFGRAVNAPRSRSSPERRTPSSSSTTTSSASPNSSSGSSSRSSGDGVGMVAGVLAPARPPDLVDSAGIELDTTLGSWDALWNRPLADLARPGAGRAVRRRGRLLARGVPARLGGFDETFFAYWEDVDLALRLEAGGRIVRARRSGARRAPARPDARRGVAGAAAPRGVRARVRARAYRVARTGLLPAPDRGARLAGAPRPPRDPPGGGADPRAGSRDEGGLARPALRAPLELATVSFGEALRRQAGILRLRVTGGLPSHFDGVVAERPLRASAPDRRTSGPSGRDG